MLLWCGYFTNFNLVVQILLASVAFRSIVLPIRMIFTLALTVGWVYGLSAIVYCMASTTKVHGLYWVPPCIVFSVIVGAIFVL